jgi:hypothetical protein
MGSESIDLKESVDDTFPKIQQAIGSSDYKIKTIEANKSIIAEGNREFSWAIVIILAILIWPAAIVYYFTRHRSGVTIIVTPGADSGCKVTINSNGKTGDQVMQSIVNILQ